MWLHVCEKLPFRGVSTIMVQKEQQQEEYLPKKEFDDFRTNDFEHLQKKVDKISGSVSFIKGQLWVGIPLLLLALGIIMQRVL